MIPITKELLQKFYRGECTEQECAAIELWQQSAEATMDHVSERKLMEIEARIWKNIEPKSPRISKLKTIQTYIELIPYGYAASVLLVIVFVWLQIAKSTGTLSEPIVYKLNSSLQKTTEVNGLNFMLASNSNAVVTTPLHGKRGDISFCGAVQITNNSGIDIDYVFESACKKSAYTRKHVTFQPGKTYIAIHNFYKTDEVIVMRKENLMEFPDAISPDLISEFSI